MTFHDILVLASAWLEHDKRVSYRALQRQFGLDEAALADLKFELIEVKQLAVDHGGTMLVWCGVESRAVSGPAAAPQPPAGPAGRTLQVPALLTVRLPQEAERRQLTVMFCDLVDSTRLAGQLDPEDWREVVRAYQRACAAVVQRFDGTIAQYLGDGLLVYFGYPQAHENDAERAVRSGLDMLAALAALNAELAWDANLRLAIRVGIHTGPVVVGSMGGHGRQEQLALGETPHIASRLQGLAAPDTVLISAETYRLVQGYFTCQALPAQTLRGMSQAMVLYQVQAAHGAHSRLEVAATHGLTPLVGREPEVALLLARWAQVRAGHGQAVVLSGEGGIGKSRLVRVMIEQADRSGVPCRTFRCSPHHTNSALYPVVEHLERLLQWRQDDTAADKLARLQGALATSSLPLEEVLPLFAGLLSLPLPQGDAATSGNPQRQRQMLHEALVVWLFEGARTQPVMMVWDDVQWADPSTLELLGLCQEHLPTTHGLMLLTCRPDFHVPWQSQAHLSILALTRLARPQAETMITRLTGDKALPAEVLEQIVRRTDGVPLFIEEVTKMVLESGLLGEADGRYTLPGPLPPLAIPSTLQDALMARLDRLVTAKGVAQLGAVLGRQFAYALLQAVAHLDDATLQRELGRLVEAELVYQQGMPPDATYTFKHALIQEAAYQSLLRRTRQQYHQQIAQVLEAQFPDVLTIQPELLAHHCTEAGLTPQAVRYWHLAGHRALERSAPVEALAHLRQGLALLQQVPDTAERARHELALQTTFGATLVVTKGYGAPDVAQAYRRALALHRRVGEPAQLFPVLGGLWQFHAVHAEYQQARALAEQLLTLAEEAQDAALLLGAHTVLGQSFYMLGDFAGAQAHLERGLALDAPQHSHALLLGGENPGVACRGFAAWTLWVLGYPDTALQHMQAALQLAETLRSPFNLAWARRGMAWLHQLRREGAAAQAHADVLIALASEQGFVYWRALGTMFRSWALAMEGQATAGLEQSRQALSTLRATGSEFGRPHFLALLAEIAGHVGQPEAGLAVLAEALEVVRSSGEAYYHAELYRLRGVLLLAASLDLQAEAETCLHQAVEVARQQHAKSWELRAVINLSRLWQQQGKCAAAHALLAPVYAWFTEGFDTADLQEARALLATLT